jgi:hypothetical protein
LLGPVPPPPAMAEAAINRQNAPVQAQARYRVCENARVLLLPLQLHRY